MRDISTLEAIRTRGNRPPRTLRFPRLRGVTRVVAGLWLAVSAVNFTVWLVAAVISGSVDSPWWLWAFAGGGIAVALVWCADRARTTPPRADDHGDF